MKTGYIKFLSAILCAALFLPLITLITLLISCQTNNGNGDNKNTDNIDNSAQSDGQNGVEQPTEKIIPDLPDVNYDGYQFSFLSMTGEEDYERDDFFAEEENGDVINDAKYARNTHVEEKYGVKINTVNLGNYTMGSGFGNMKKAISAGDYSYDAAVFSAYDITSCVTGGFLLDLNSIPPLDLSKPWWDQRANEDLSIKGRMFFTTGDISVTMSSSVWVILFNKKLLKDYAIEDPYQLVRGGKWTFDKFAELSRQVNTDLSGAGIYDQYNLYGMIACDDIMHCALNSIGEKCAKINNNGEIELSLYNERTIAAMNKYMDFSYDKTNVFAFQRVSDDTAYTMFENDQALFFPHGTATAIKLRAMETDFGILPFPKLDENQGGYYSPMINWWSLFVCVPILQENAERTAVIIEALAAESRYTVRPAYYEKSLIGKYSRDEESHEMLDIIFATRTYDFGWYFNFGGYNDSLYTLFRTYNRDFTSMYEKGLSKAEKDVQKTNDLFDEFLG